jgi:hypothetical protein
VLHDMFAMPFDEIAPVVRRSPSAAGQFASRARRRGRGWPRFLTLISPNNEKLSTPSSPRCAAVTSKAFWRGSTQMSRCEWTKLRRVRLRRRRSAVRGTGPKGTRILEDWQIRTTGARQWGGGAPMGAAGPAASSAQLHDHTGEGRRGGRRSRAFASSTWWSSMNDVVVSRFSIRSMLGPSDVSLEMYGRRATRLRSHHFCRIFHGECRYRLLCSSRRDHHHADQNK